MHLAELLEQVDHVVRFAGHFMMSEAKKFNREEVEFKTHHNDMVTHVDKATEHTLAHSLKKLLPEAGFITEEGTMTELADRYNWVIDPLDGTTNFIHGLPVFCISVALLEYGEPVLAQVFDPTRGDSWQAIKGARTYFNNKPLKAQRASNFAEALVATGFPYYEFDTLEEYMKIVSDFIRTTRGVRRMGSAAIDLCYTAMGRFDGFFEYNLQPYDVAGGALICKQAGVEIIDFKGGDDWLFGGEILAAVPAMKDAMLDLIQGRWPANHVGPAAEKWKTGRPNTQPVGA